MADVQYTTVEYTPKHRREWDRFVESSANGTLFHTQAFLDYHPAKRFRFLHRLVYRGRRLVAVIPGGLAGDMFKSPTGSSFGGFVVGKDFGIEEADGVVKAFIRDCAHRMVKEVYITPPMQVYQHPFNEAVEYSLNYNHFIVVSSLYSSVADLSVVRGKADIARKARYSVNKAIRMGVRVEEKNDFRTAYPILLKNKEKFDVRPTHSLRELRAIDKNLPGRQTLFLAHWKKKPVAGLMLFTANAHCALIFYNMQLPQYRHLCASNLLVEHALRWCAERGIRYVDFGVSADTFCSDPMEPSWSLIQFKESMGFCGCQRKTYYRRIY